jgi:two-component system, NtrC family, sensor histidine kinase HydH
VPASFSPRWLRAIRAQDLVWFLLFAVLAVTSPGLDASECSLLLALLVWQVAEPKLTALASMRGRILSIVLKLVLGYLLIGYTGGLNSRYFLVLLLPVVTGATTFGVFGTLLLALVAGGAYLSFLLYVDWIQYVLGPSEIAELAVRVAFLAMAGNLANTLAEDLRRQSERSRRTAEQLSEANQHLQEAEEAVRRSDRLAALGQLTAGLAHELRNPLGTIKASAEMLEKNLPAGNDLAREMAGFIATEVDRTNSLVTRFLQFARPLQVKVETADLTAVLDRAAAAVERETPRVAIYRNYSPDIPPFPLDAELMERVFYNLLLNAAQASSEGGAVTVKTRAAGGTAEVAVIDRGSGIDPAQMDSIFNPFFTTKPEGVGLGLAIVAKIVDEHGGKIAVESEPAKGSVFRVQLPMVRPAAHTSE